jgi:hypothetical protein
VSIRRKLLNHVPIYVSLNDRREYSRVLILEEFVGSNSGLLLMLSWDSLEGIEDTQLKTSVTIDAPDTDIRIVFAPV